MQPTKEKKLVEDLLNLKGSAVELIEGMLEETCSQTKHLAKEISGSLDLDATYNTMKDFYELMRDQRIKDMSFDDEAERGLFRAYHIIVHFKDFGIDLGKAGQSVLFVGRVSWAS